MSKPKMLGQCLCQWHSQGEQKRVEGSVEVREWQEIKMREKERIKGNWKFEGENRKNGGGL